MDEVTGHPGSGTRPETLPQPGFLYRPIVFETPERLSVLSAWTEHTPFALWIVDAVRPSILVELGAHAGVSYCAFAQAVKALGLPTACYAVDTWEGDAHTNKSEASYADDVLGDLRRHHDPRYAGFSTLVQSTFEAAAGGFADGSIDLLHIDGYHTYEAVLGDFETWFPKLSNGSVVLFHDINERGGDFGAWRFWDEVKDRYPSFHFLHGHGLGVLAVGKEQTAPIRWLTSLPETDRATVRRFFAGRGHQVQVLVDLEVSETRGKASATHADNLQVALDNQTKNLDQTIDAYEKRLQDAFRQLHESNLKLEVSETRGKASATHADNLQVALDNQTKNLDQTIDAYEKRLQD
ncbi:MAG: class I SAM-dependent methyltransferase, partial [Alphaproteobacteria bacterium]|nr:class I SAM-dependent methyltransferase [Alphaproteobacteria bacterium]